MDSSPLAQQELCVSIAVQTNGWKHIYPLQIEASFALKNAGRKTCHNKKISSAICSEKLFLKQRTGTFVGCIGAFWFTAMRKSILLAQAQKGLIIKCVLSSLSCSEDGEVGLCITKPLLFLCNYKRVNSQTHALLERFLFPHFQKRSLPHTFQYSKPFQIVI